MAKVAPVATTSRDRETPRRRAWPATPYSAIGAARSAGTGGKGNRVACTTAMPPATRKAAIGKRLRASSAQSATAVAAHHHRTLARQLPSDPKAAMSLGLAASTVRKSLPAGSESSASSPTMPVSISSGLRRRASRNGPFMPASVRPYGGAGHLPGVVWPGTP